MERTMSDLKLDQQVGLRIMGFREQRGYSAEFLAQLVGPPLTGKLIEDYETGIWPIPVCHLLRISAAIEVSIPVLLSGVSLE
ncbi:MAG: helix-turn-helix transcriptional regulator [Planctomycetota bacterium]